MATPSEKLKPFLNRTGGPADNFWHLLIKDNLNHNDFVSTTRAGLIKPDGRPAGAEAFEKAKNCFNMNLAREEEEEGRVSNRLPKDLARKLWTLISMYPQYLQWHTHQLMDRYRCV
jgi:hypothetical protein